VSKKKHPSDGKKNKAPLNSLPLPQRSRKTLPVQVRKTLPRAEHWSLTPEKLKHSLPTAG